MKKHLMQFLLVLLPCLAWGQTRLINDGVIIKVGAGTDFRSQNGSIDNKNSGQIINDGNIYLDLDFNQNTGATYTGGASSWLWFEGGANQNAAGDATLDIARLKADNGNNVVLATNVNISLLLDFVNNTKVVLGTNNLVMAPAADITNYDANNYVVTNNTGILQRQVTAAPVVFPIGNSTYNPFTIDNAGTTDNFRARVEDLVYDAGTTGNLETDNIVNRTWHIDEQTVGGSNANITVQWNSSEELTSFDRNNCAVSHWDGSFWDHTMAYNAATNVGVNTWTQTRSGQSTFSPFAVEDTKMDLPVELLSFTAVRSSPMVVDLNWVTATELNNNGFEVERMLADETTFSKIGWVDGAGTTTSTQYYELLDPNGYSGLSYYRLKQIDFDGTFSYSPIRAVEGNKEGANVKLFPNPTKDGINLQFNDIKSKNVQIRIYAADGKLVLDKQEAISAYTVIHLEEVKDLAASTYMIQLIFDNGEARTIRFIKSFNE